MQSRANILIVDDNPEDIDFASRILRAAGHDVLDIADIRSGLAMASRERFDVIILDHRFENPAAVGISVVHDFAQKAAAGVIMLTAFGDPDLEMDAKALGAKAYLPKPVDSQTLLDTVQRTLSGPRPDPR